MKKNTKDVIADQNQEQGFLKIKNFERIETKNVDYVQDVG